LATALQTTDQLYRVDFKQELSYRKQIACQLHRQYVEGINSSAVNLKSWLKGLSRSLEMEPFDKLYMTYH